MAKFSPPENINFGNPAEWPDWKQRFMRFRMATKMNKEEDPVQISSLIYCMGREAEHVFGSLQFAEQGDEAQFDKVMQKLDDYFSPRETLYMNKLGSINVNRNPASRLKLLSGRCMRLQNIVSFRTKRNN